VIRQASKETGKQVKLDITGGSIELDRGVLDRMTPAFDTASQRVAMASRDPEVENRRRKDATGTI